MRVLNSQQMRAADRRTIDEIGVPSASLMENAGREVVAAMEASFPELGSMRVAVLCGRGNNGGDGFVVARTLLERRMDVAVFLMARRSEVGGDARAKLEALAPHAAEIVEIADLGDWERHRARVTGAGLIVDAMFGTGLVRPLSGVAETIVADVNGSGRPVIAIDLPSGLSADTGEITGPAIRAAVTVALGAPKLPHVLSPADTLVGKLVVADIGIPAHVLDEVSGPQVEMLTRDAVRSLIPARRPDSHKGTYGRVLIVAGSLGKTGAAYLAAMAALRSGAGLVTVATPASCLPIVASLGAEYMTEALPETRPGILAPDALDRVLHLDADVIAIGPGLGRASSTSSLVQQLVARSAVPVVIDADGLTAFAGAVDRLRAREGVDVIVTPHPGEMSRLTGLSIAAIQARRLETARDFAAAHRVHVVLKGHRTVIATPAGRALINTTGNPGMATAGTGDVLTGAIAAWLGQLKDPARAATLAVYLHGHAGDLAAAQEGETALIASDLIATMGAAVLDVTALASAP
jgi:NAD(P)H-hydrate epimerase